MSETAEKRSVGFMVFYINIYPDLGQQIEPMVYMIKEMNKPLMDQLAADGRYLCLFVPTIKEASRVEKIDYDLPFPRCIADSADVEREGAASRKKKIEGHVFRGIITIYINFHPDVKIDVKETIDLVRSVNQDVLKQIATDGRYQIMFVPTTKEATRIEKVDYDEAFPRFVPRSVKNRPALMPKIAREDEESEGNDEEENEE